MSWTCKYCTKKVYHAEKMEYDGMIFHAKCHGKWAQEQKCNGKGAWGGQYDLPADVQPAYYRTADGEAAARLETGAEYKGISPKVIQCSQCGQPSDARFCANCGTEVLVDGHSTQ